MAAEIPHHQQHKRNSRAKFEQSHVQQVYDEIASSVNDIEHRAWPNVKRFLKKLDKGALVADIAEKETNEPVHDENSKVACSPSEDSDQRWHPPLFFSFFQSSTGPTLEHCLTHLIRVFAVSLKGCGNGRYLSINNNTYKVGVDVCQPLVDNSRSKGHEVAYADNLYLPFRSDMFDAVVSIGVIHHFCSPDRRVRAIRELARIMKPGGKLMLYVWAYEQKHRKFDSQDVLVPWHDGRKLKRTDSSASCQSSSGLSSMSSFSEDDSSELELSESLSRRRSQSRDISLSRERSTKRSPINRQSSVSLEDISTISNFNSNYYSLDFSPTDSPKRRQLPDLNAISKHQNNKSSLVNECRKIEASLRAMSAGCLFEKELQITRSDRDFSSHGNIQKCQHGSLENLKKCKSNSTPSATSPRSRPFKRSSGSRSSPVYLRSVKGVDSKDSALNRILSIDEISCKGSTGDRSPIDIYLDDDDEVFFVFDDTSAPVIKPVNPSTESRFTVPDSKTGKNEWTNETFDQVDVKFKPERPVFKALSGKQKEKESKENGKSVFGLLKSKVLQIFNRDENDGASSANLNKSVPTKIPPRTNNHVKQMVMTPELSHDLINMATKLNFAVREFPMSSCLDVEKCIESPKSPKICVKFDIGGDNLENKVVSPRHLGKFSFRQESVDNYKKSSRSIKRLEKGESFDKNAKSSKLDRRQDKKFSPNQLQRVNSGNDLLKSAIRNSTMKQNSPTSEMNRSNPFMVRSFSSDYVEDPSTAYPFENMNESDNEDMIIESPLEVLSIEQTLYDCFMRLDVDKTEDDTGKSKQNSTTNGDKRGSVCSEISLDSIEEMDDQWEYGDTIYTDDKINMKLEKIGENTIEVGGTNTIRAKAENGSAANGIKSGYSDCAARFADRKMVHGSDSICNGTVNGVSPRHCDTKLIEGKDSGKRTLKMSERKSLNNARKDESKDMCNADNETTHELDQTRYLGKSCDNSGTNCPDDIPDVSCVGKAKEGSVSTKLCRYYHVFREGELEKLISSHIKDLHIVQCFYDHANWCLVAVKVDTESAGV